MQKSSTPITLEVERYDRDQCLGLNVGKVGLIVFSLLLAGMARKEDQLNRGQKLLAIRLHVNLCYAVCCTLTWLTIPGY